MNVRTKNISKALFFSDIKHFTHELHTEIISKYIDIGYAIFHNLIKVYRHTYFYSEMRRSDFLNNDIIFYAILNNEIMICKLEFYFRMAARKINIWIKSVIIL